MGGGVINATPRRFTLGKVTPYPLYRRFVGPRASLDGCGISRPTGI